ncbi:MAG: MBL fold metallo-hydrolase [Turicibacter sp.]|nr:MBL fold metallo-hydrolase [Turicibacter sp.]
MKIYPMALGPVGTNCYVLSVGNRAVVVDPAGEPKKILNYLANHKLVVEAILLTHGHFDHIGAVNEVIEKFPVPVFSHKRELEYFNNPDVNLSSHFGAAYVLDAGTDYRWIGEGDSIEVLGQPVSINHVPGHTPGSITFHFKEQGVIFTGDTLFQGSMGRTDLIYGNHELLHHGIKTKLLTLPPQTVAYSGHGGATTIEAELGNNRFFA